MYFYQAFLGLLVLISILITRTYGTAKLMLRFHQFSNPGSRNFLGGCCDGEVRGDNCSEECDYSINICLKRSENDTCSLGTYVVGSIDAVDSSFVFPPTFINGLANPVPLGMDVWTGNVIVEINMMDEDTQREEIVDKYVLDFTVNDPVRERRLRDDDFTLWALRGQRQFRPSRLNVSLAVRCDSYYYDNDCSVNCVDVDSCEGHYSCNTVTGDKHCLDGWAGDNCSIPVSQEHGCSADQLCDNNALCIRWGDQSDQFYCCCEPGFTGENCETDIDECASDPCSNGGTCIQGTPGTYSCSCAERFKGQNCEEQKTCADKPCLNAGECISILDNTFYCRCNENYTGVTCETSLLTTTTISTSTEPTTTPTTTESTTTLSTTPTCSADYYGPNCAIYCIAMDGCQGHYQCDPDMGNRLCNPGWGGVSCTNPTTPDTSCGCANGGTCFQGSCCCPPKFFGQFCQISSQTFCSSNPCINQGTCYEDETGYLCVCPSTYTGENCETSLVTTTAVPACPQDFYGPSCMVYCLPQDSCTEGQFFCHPLTGEKLCRFGWMGTECNIRDPSARHEVECPDSTCRNGGVCANNTCCCPIGYTGSLCHIEILECASYPCQNGGRCHDMVADYLCQCKHGYSGKNCESLIDTSGETTTTSPDPCLTVSCQNNGVCVAAGTRAICICSEGYLGNLCEETAVFTTTTLSPGQTGCPQDYYGFDCRVYCKEQDSCNGGHYYCHPRDGRKLCRSGWIGDICNTRILYPEIDPECPAGGVGCLNIGQCFNQSCCCASGFKGESCQEEVLPCETKPCTGNRICLDLVGSYSCPCHPSYEGDNCDIYIGPSTTTFTFSSNITTLSTESSTTEVCGQCLNGGFCFIDSPVCFCVYPFTGIYCESLIITSTRESSIPTDTTTATPNTANSSALVSSTSSVFAVSGSSTSSQAVNTTIESSSTTLVGSTNITTVERSSSESTTEVSSNISLTAITTEETPSTSIKDISTDITTAQMSSSGSTTGVSSNISLTVISAEATSSTSIKDITTDITTAQISSSGSTTGVPSNISLTTVTTEATSSTSRKYITTDITTAEISSSERTTEVSSNISLTAITAETTSSTSIKDITTDITTAEISSSGSTTGVSSNISLTAITAETTSSTSIKDITTDITTAGLSSSESTSEVSYNSITGVPTQSTSRTSVTVDTSGVTDSTTAPTTTYITESTTEVSSSIFITKETTSDVSSASNTARLTSQTNEVVVTVSSSKGMLVSSESPTTQTTQTTIPPTTLAPSRIDVVYFRGNISDNQQAILEVILQSSMVRTMNESGCCIDITILDKTTYVDPLGKIVVGYTYNVSNTTGGSLSALESPKIQTYYDNADNLLGTTEPFSQKGVTIYRGPPQNLNNLDRAYTVIFDGQMKDSMMAAAEQTVASAWHKADPNCQCTYRATILRKEPYIGDYGTQITRVYYIVKRDGQVVNPRVMAPPTVKQINLEVGVKQNLNMAYEGATELPYDLHYNIRLDRSIALNGDEGRRFRQALQNAWQEYARAISSLCTPVLCEVNVLYTRPTAFFTRDGKNISEVDYFVSMNGRSLDPVLFPGPSIILLRNERVPICDCAAARIPFIDINGILDWKDARSLARELLNAHGHDGNIPVIHRENHLDSAGNPVTRLYYRPQTPNSVIMEPLPESAIQTVLSTTSLQRPNGPMRRAYTMYLDGEVNQDNVDQIENMIRQAWNISNPDIPGELIDVDVSSLNSSYYGKNGNGSVTKVVYTVSIQDADSGFTNAGEPSVAVIELVSTPNLNTCGCVGRVGRELTVIGNVNGNSTGIIESTIGQAWLEANPDFKGTISVAVRSVQKTVVGGTSEKPSRMTYTISTSGTSDGFTDEDLNRPSVDNIKTRFNNADIGVTVYTGTERNPPDNNDWVIPVAVVLALLFFVLIIIVIVLVVRSVRHRKSRTLKQKPEELNGFNPEHFSTQPEFDNPAFSVDDPDLDDSKTNTYYVNMDNE